MLNYVLHRKCGASFINSKTITLQHKHAADTDGGAPVARLSKHVNESSCQPRTNCLFCIVSWWGWGNVLYNYTKSIGLLVLLSCSRRFTQCIHGKKMFCIFQGNTYMKFFVKIGLKSLMWYLNKRKTLIGKTSSRGFFHTIFYRLNLCLIEMFNIVWEKLKSIHLFMLRRQIRRRSGCYTWSCRKYPVLKTCWMQLWSFMSQSVSKEHVSNSHRNACFCWNFPRNL